jgi:hypothetical protein
VREAIARHLGRPGGSDEPSILRPTHDASHFVFPLQPATDDGSCVIEPSVRCTHCNYCNSLGH